MAKAHMVVRMSEVPEVKHLVEQLVEERDELRRLLQEWEPRIRCRQCGCRYSERACGPSHALVDAMVKGEQ